MRYRDSNESVVHGPSTIRKTIMRRRTSARAAVLTGTTAVALFGLVGCGSPEAMSPVTSRGSDVNGLFIWSTVLGTLVVLALAAWLGFTLVRYRHRPGGAVAPHSGNDGKMQLIWTGALLAFFAVLAIFMVRTLRAVDAPPDAAAMEVRVIGHQWWWEYQYPELGLTTANELHVPVGRPLRLRIETADVIHSFWVPRFGWKMDGIPNNPNDIVVQVDEAGVYDGVCTEFCGAQHAWMRVRVVAEAPADFDTWVNEQQQPATVAQGDVVQAGMEVFLTNSCVSCHTVRFPSGDETTGGIGPDLTHVGSRAMLGSGVLTNTPENMRDWIQNPDQIKPGVLMPPFNDLTDQELDALVRYLESLT